MSEKPKSIQEHVDALLDTWNALLIDQLEFKIGTLGPIKRCEKCGQIVRGPRR